MISLTRDSLTDLAGIVRREWLVTNGIGGFASSTICGLNTRRYHGLLIASLQPPVRRTVMVSKLDAVATYRGKRFELATNEFGDGTIAPHGYIHLEAFALDGQMPVWTWLLGDALLEQRVWMAYGENTTYVTFHVVRGDAPVSLNVAPLCTYRDFHSHHRGYRDTLVTPITHGIRLDPYHGATPCRVLADQGTCHIAPEWHWNFRHRVEGERGLDDLEDLVRPATFEVTLEPGTTVAFTLTAEPTDPLAASASLARERARQRGLLEAPAVRALFGTDRAHDALLRQLVLAADQFIVERTVVGAEPSGTADAQSSSGKHTVIAGYPWFSDWGRDTMIALPGLTLTTGRHEIAASILRTFAKFVSEGMLPNLFPDGGSAPEYNTVDATLWYFVAVDEYIRASTDRTLLRELYPTLRSIVRWHQRGTRYGIRVDAGDGLLRAGEPGAQLTWMDAKIGDWVVTPRTGKPVEVNALWFNALAIMRDFAVQLDDVDEAREYGSAAERVARSFNERFWYDAGGYLYDVIDGPEGNDASLRPNQLFAISLRHGLLDNGRARAVVDLCASELWTPVGLRSLSARTGTVPSSTEPEPRYAGRYAGGPHERDAIYHQGTVWSWLLGAFAAAHYRVYQDAPRARAYLDGIAAHLRDACLGQIGEIFDGDAPFTPRGCFAQAWGVAEILRVSGELDESETHHEKRGKARSRNTVL